MSQPDPAVRRPSLSPCTACAHPVGPRALACPACGQPGPGAPPAPEAPKPRKASVARLISVNLFWLWCAGTLGIAFYEFAAAGARGADLPPEMLGALALGAMAPVLIIGVIGAILLGLIVLMTRPGD